MDQERAAYDARRIALKQALGVGVAIVCWGRPAAAAAAKLTKEAVKYTDHGNVEGKDCDDCSQFIPGKKANGPATCRIVEGPISPHGHCIAFSPKPKPKPKPKT